jgi:hypothetical protein
MDGNKVMVRRARSAHGCGEQEFVVITGARLEDYAHACYPAAIPAPLPPSIAVQKNHHKSLKKMAPRAGAALLFAAIRPRLAILCKNGSLQG